MLVAEIDLSDFRAAVAETQRALELGRRKAVAAAAIEAAQYARAIGPFKDRTGQLRSGIVARFLNSDGNSVLWELLSPMPYSRYVEEGTRPHEIWPKAAHGLKGPLRNGQTRRATGRGPHEHIVGRGIALRWVSGGVTHFARMVHHPGTPPLPFIGPAYLKAQAVLEREFELMFGVVASLWS
jgi:hypothetical protein